MAQHVRPDSLTMAIPIDSLMQLPQGAAFIKQSGRAHTSLSINRQQGKPDVIYVETYCDSLARLVAFYQSRLDSTSGRSDDNHTSNITVQTTKVHPTDAIKTGSIAFLLGGIAGIVSTILIKKKTL